MVFSDTEDAGDGNASDYDRAMSSPDDEGGNHRSGKLPRYQYPTFQDNNNDDDSVQDDEFVPKRPAMSHEERIYGVFYTEDMEESSDEGGKRRQQRKSKKKKPFFKASSGASSKHSIAPMFVKGATLEPSKEEGEEEETDKTHLKPPPHEETKDDRDSTSPPGKNQPSPQELAEEQERKQRVEQANQHFLNLLQQKGGRKRPRDEEPPPQQQEAPSQTLGRGGLGFSPGLGFSQSQGTEPDGDSSSRGLGFQPAGVGLGFQKASTNEETSAPQDTWDRPTTGLGFAQFGSQPAQQPPPAKKLDPNLGKWEKHTKGIGAKLLAKMGYAGSGGLGSEARKASSSRTSSGPIQVKVRPSNLGLGFGGFQEATHLNKQQEAKEKKKMETKAAKNKKEHFQSGGGMDAWQSSLPTVQDLLKDDSSWRNHADEASSKKKRKTEAKEKAKVVSYQDLLEQQKQRSKGVKIIDMRGPQPTTSEAESSSSAAAKEPPLAEELLHNVSLLMGTHESKLYSAHQMEASTRQKLDSMKEDALALERKQQELQQRHDKMSQAIQILDEMERAVGEQSGTNVLQKAKPLLRRLADTFTSQERTSFQFSQAILPAILQPVLEDEFLVQWDPLKLSINESRERIRSGVDALVTSLPLEDAGERVNLIESVWNKFILVRARQALEDSDWLAANGAEHCAALYDMLRQLAGEMTQSQTVTESAVDSDHVFFQGNDDQSAKDSPLARRVQKELIHGTVHPKLLQIVSSWKAKLDASGVALSKPLDTVVLPWLVHLDSSGFLQPLLQDCRSKVRNALTFLQKNLQGIGYLEEASRTLRPWRGVLKTKYVEEMVSNFITPTLARAIAIDKLTLGGEQDFSLVHLLFRLHTDGLLSNMEFLSVLEGEVLNQVCHALYDFVQNSTRTGKDKDILVQHYRSWKGRLLGGEQPSSAVSESQRVLREDEMVCRHFLAMLLMIQPASGSSNDIPCPPTTNYRVVLSRKAVEKRRREAADLARMEAAGVAPGVAVRDPTHEARARLAQEGGSHIPTFRKVVEEFASEQGVLFQPRLGGSKATEVDGKQVFMFGSVPVYLDSNVVYAQQKDKEWDPVSLDELANRAASKS